LPPPPPQHDDDACLIIDKVTGASQEALAGDHGTMLSRQPAWSITSAFLATTIPSPGGLKEIAMHALAKRCLGFDFCNRATSNFCSHPSWQGV
jgi:hypothetical protein